MCDHDRCRSAATPGHSFTWYRDADGYCVVDGYHSVGGWPVADGRQPSLGPDRRFLKCMLLDMTLLSGHGQTGVAAAGCTHNYARVRCYAASSIAHWYEAESHVLPSGASAVDTPARTARREMARSLRGARCEEPWHSMRSTGVRMAAVRRLTCMGRERLHAAD